MPRKLNQRTWSYFVGQTPFNLSADRDEDYMRLSFKIVLFSLDLICFIINRIILKKHSTRHDVVHLIDVHTIIAHNDINAIFLVSKSVPTTRRRLLRMLQITEHCKKNKQVRQRLCQSFYENPQHIIRQIFFTVVFYTQQSLQKKIELTTNYY